VLTGLLPEVPPQVSELALKAYFQFLAATVAFGCSLVSTSHGAEPAAQATQDAPESVEFFEKKVRPILANSCYACHSAETKPAGGLRVDDRNGLLMGGNGGAAIVPGDPAKGTFLQRINHTDPKRKMPKEGDELTETQVADLTAWIKSGAAWPREKIPASLGKIRPDYDKLKAEHWAWQPLTDPKAPKVKQNAWPANDVDRFILAKLESKNLKPVSDADPLTLLRRVTYDLTGLPPTPEEIAAFQKDSSPSAYARVVDRLLASPQFGERWGRHWLDVARYGESTGPSRNIPYPHAWKYRDYVLDAVNKDVPYNRFIQEQIAGDLLPAANNEERDRLLTATGFLALGVKDVNQRFKVRFIMDNVDEQIDAVSRSVLGLTVSCARCHDHKFDPIATTDYYAMAGIFTSTDNCAGVRNKMGGGGLDYYDPSMLVKLATDNIPAVEPEKLAKLEAEVEAAKKAWDGIRGTPEGLAKGPNGQPKQRPFRVKYERLQAELSNIADPASRGFAVHGVRDSKTIADTEVRIRGEAERLGPTVPRGFLTTFNVPNTPKIAPENSGRLELSEWLTNPQNPLTARVAVNRVWQHLFTVGIVNTADNFGVNGDRPSHPELLDYLAQQFIRDGWSVKSLVRNLALSHAYRLGSEAPPAYQEQDPANRLVWRHSPRRLEAEEVRDALLVSSGRLQPRSAGGPASKDLKMIEMRDNGVEAKNIHEAADGGLVRSVYLPLLRGVTPKSLEAFDPVDQTLVSGHRDATTVPTQALYLLNSTFVRRQSLALAEKLQSEKGAGDSKRINEAYLLTLGREPTKQEVTRALQFLGEYETAYQEATPVEAIQVAVATPVAEAAQESNSDTKPAPAVPANPDDIDRTEAVIKEDSVEPKTPKAAAWMTFVQALYASAEFRFVR